MWFMNWGRHPRGLAGGLAAFGVVLLITAQQMAEWKGLTLLGVALIVPSVIWLVGDVQGSKPKESVWRIVVGLAVAVGVWGLALFPAADQTPFSHVR